MTKKSKYGNRKIENEYGKFDSVLEYERFLFLRQASREGLIDCLERQVPFELIPTQYITIEKHNKRGIRLIKKVAERATMYYADFVYYKHEGNSFVKVVEDAKGRRTKEYILKRKLMRLNYTPIREVTKATEPI